MSLEGHSGDPGEPFGLILGALGVVRQALVGRLDVGSFGGHSAGLSGAFGLMLGALGLIWETLVDHLGPF